MGILRRLAEGRPIRTTLAFRTDPAQHRHHEVAPWIRALKPSPEPFASETNSIPTLSSACPNYTQGTRSGDHDEIPQWQAKVPEASRFVLMHEAMAASGPASVYMSPASTRIDADTI